jgi:type IV secretion system protein VirB5
MTIACALVSIGIVPRAHAQWAVIDVDAIAQLVQQVQTLQQSLSTAESELDQARQEYRAMTGDRGMAQLLGGAVRNYLPTDESELDALLNQSGGQYGSVASSLQQFITANAALSQSELARLAPEGAAQLQAVRRSTALLQAVTSEAISRTSDRFASLQQLIDSIGRASDQKAALDLHARIAAEQSMLQNEQTKLEVLYQAAHGLEWADRTRSRELVVSGHGAFASRYQPQP